MMFRGALARLAKMGGRDMALELLDRFLAEGPQRLEAARKALASGDMKDLQLHLHRLCSDAGWLGAGDVQQLANLLEQRAAHSDLTGFAEKLEELSGLCYSTSVQLEQEKVRLTDPDYNSAEVPPGKAPK